MKQLLATSGLKTATSVFEFATPGIGHIIKAAGADFVFLDMEHSGFDMSEMKRLLRYCEAAELPALVRPPSKSYHHMARLLDIGADGLMLPMVANAEEAAAIVKAMKYTPDGERGVALGVAHDRYRDGPVAAKFAQANARTACVCLIETAQGVENVEAIAAVEGVDCLWVGHFDLSCSLGVAGDFAAPVFIEAMARVVAAGKAQGLALGRLAASVEEAGALYAQGFDTICYGLDSNLLRDTLAAGLTGIRENCA